MRALNVAATNTTTVDPNSTLHILTGSYASPCFEVAVSRLLVATVAVAGHMPPPADAGRSGRDAVADVNDTIAEPALVEELEVSARQRRHG